MTGNQISSASLEKTASAYTDKFSGLSQRQWDRLSDLLRTAAAEERSVGSSDVSLATGLGGPDTLVLLSVLTRDGSLGRLRLLVSHEGCPEEGLEDRDHHDEGLPYLPWACPACGASIQNEDGLRYESALKPPVLPRNHATDP